MLRPFLSPEVNENTVHSHLRLPSTHRALGASERPDQWGFWSNRVYEPWFQSALGTSEVDTWNCIKEREEARFFHIRCWGKGNKILFAFLRIYYTNSSRVGWCSYNPLFPISPSAYRSTLTQDSLLLSKLEWSPSSLHFRTGRPFADLP